jgi:hypothetical protein
MKKLFGVFMKMHYTYSIGSQHMDVLGAVGGSVGHRLIAMDRLEQTFLAGNRCRMSAQAKDWHEAHFAR